MPLAETGRFFRMGDVPLRLLTIGMLASTLCLASGCLNLGGWHYEEIGRVKAPDGVVEAVLVRGNGGATTSYSFSVFLVPGATSFDEKAREVDDFHYIVELRLVPSDEASSLDERDRT